MKSFKIEKKDFTALKEQGAYVDGVLHLKPLKDRANVAVLSEYECSLTNEECKRVKDGEIIGFTRAGRSYVARLEDGKIVVYHSYDTSAKYVIVGSDIVPVVFDKQ